MRRTRLAGRACPQHTTNVCRFIGYALASLLLGCSGDETPDEASIEEPVATELQAYAYVGSERCGGCHTAQYQAWLGSHHQLAMASPSPQTVLGDFSGQVFHHHEEITQFSQRNGAYVLQVDTGKGAMESYPVLYTFGVSPLQQYLVSHPAGRLQAHSVAWDSRPADEGGGRWFHLFPDVVDDIDALHWTKPGLNWNVMCADCHSTAVKKSYDPSSNSYATTYAEISVGCEACHGPGSGHAADPSQPVLELVSRSEQINSCAPCHSRRSQLAEGFDPSKDFYDHYTPALLDQGLYHPDGQILDEVYVYGSYLQSKMYAAGVACADCHDPHRAQTRIGGNALCTQCHNESGRADFPTLAKGAYDSGQHHFHAAESPGSRCVACHMPSKVYMGVDERHDHSFRIPRPDLTAQLGVPNACNACHEDRSPAWAVAEIASRSGDEPDEHFASTIAAARQSLPQAEPRLVAIAQLANTPSMVRATALSMMRQYSGAASALALERGLRSSEVLIKLGALRGAERWPPLRRFAKAKHLLNDPLLAVRSEATRVLAPAVAELDSHDRTDLTRKIRQHLDTLTLHQDTAAGLTNIASMHLLLADAVRAEAHLRRAIQINSEWVPAYVNLADVLRATGRDLEGGPLLAQALALTPDNAEVMVARAFWLVRQHRQDAALSLLQQAYELEPANPRFTYLYALGLSSAQRPEDALAILDSALTRFPNDAQLPRAAYDIARSAGIVQKAEQYRAKMLGEGVDSI